MVRWFFLACIAAFAYVVNMFVFDKASSPLYTRIMVFAILNAFAFGLLLAWIHAYIPKLKTFRIGLLSALLLSFAFGAAYLSFGVIGLAKSSCNVLVRFNGLRALLNQISPDYACEWLAAVHILIGAFFLWMVLANIGKLKRDSH